MLNEALRYYSNSFGVDDYAVELRSDHAMALAAIEFGHYE